LAAQASDVATTTHRSDLKRAARALDRRDVVFVRLLNGTGEITRTSAPTAPRGSARPRFSDDPPFVRKTETTPWAWTARYSKHQGDDRRDRYAFFKGFLDNSTT